MSLSTALDDLSSGLGEAPPEQEAGTLPAWSIVPNRPMQNSSPPDAKYFAARCKILCRSEQNFFSGTEIYFQSFKIYFQGSEIYFQALEIVLFPAAKEKYLRDEEIASLYAGNYCCTGKSTRQQYKGIARLRLRGFRLEAERFFP